MNQPNRFGVFSEVGQLKQVMLHRPGLEIDRLTIENMNELLFDDLLWLKQAQKEHDEFARLLKENGAEVLYFSKCLAEAIEKPSIKEELIRKVLNFEVVDRRLTDDLIPY